MISNQVILTAKSEGAFTSSGKWACLGNQQDNDITPARRCGYVKLACNARAPPWENPPNNILFEGMPAWKKIYI